jgi:hypothetical protein
VKHDTSISRAGLHALIQDAGITYKMLQKAASEQDEEACQQWQEFVHDNLVTSMIITVDESSKDDQTIFWKYGCAPHGQCATIDADFVHGERYSVLAAMSVDVYVGMRAVPGSVDEDEFFDFIVNDCKGKTLLELEETHSGNGKGLRHSQVVLEARDFL